MSEFGGLWQHQNNPAACTKRVSLHHVEVGHYTKEEKEQAISSCNETNNMHVHLKLYCYCPCYNYSREFTSCLHIKKQVVNDSQVAMNKQFTSFNETNNWQTARKQIIHERQSSKHITRRNEISNSQAAIKETAHKKQSNKQLTNGNQTNNSQTAMKQTTHKRQ